MPHGLQTFDENGIVVYDSNTRLSRVCGVVRGSPSGVTGYVDIPADYSTGNTPFFMVTGSSVGSTLSSTNSIPDIALSGRRLTYKNLRFDVIYGVF